MKRLLIAVLLLLSVNVAFSQKYDKKIAASDKSIEDPKKGINPKTWISRGELFYEIAKAPVELISVGMSQEMYELAMAGLDDDVTATAQPETLNGKKYTVHTFNDKKVYIESAAIQFWDILKYEVPNPMQKSYEAFAKAKSLDTGGKNTKKLNEKFSLLAAQTKQEAFNKYNLSKYDEAVEFFGLAVNCLDETGEIDSLSIYYAGVIAIEAKNYAAAEKYLRRAVDINYIENGDAYFYLSEALKEGGKKDESREILEKGIVAYPENQQLIIALINSYIAAQKDPKDIIPFIKKAQEKEATNINLYIVEGDLLERLDDMEGAEKCYVKATEIDPDNFFGYYKRGLLHFNLGAKYNDQAMQEKDKEYERLLDLADRELRNALPFLEEAFKRNADEISTIQALKEINFRFRVENDKYKQDYEKYSKMLEEKNN
ncbi:MAG: tetratricopeptide repeat protein [Prevotellaceae bacterium]|jgi:tetratricopeptide (TPR) repeat protein|nr:tetratricopeptide repeat protein [Prevotellaceae bacterium]